MPRPVKLKTFNDLLHYHISLYYIQRERYPSLRLNKKKHLKIAELKEKHYLQEIDRRYPEHNTEEKRGKFREMINYLTGVFTA